ncbi:MAG: phosphoribosylamine--glycine ligase [bacterium JZ-2024 1]
MKVLIIGKGGREHCLGWKFASEGADVFFYPGNGGTAQCGTNLSTPPDWKNDSSRFDLLVFGPEDPLVKGEADEARKFGWKVFGVSKSSALLEGSKIFAKECMLRWGVPTAPYEVFTSLEQAERFLEKKPLPLVIKADGLAGGKGSFVVHQRELVPRILHSLFVEKIFGASGERILVEDYLEGEEASFTLLISTGKNHITTCTFPLSQDHKRLLDGDKGPNTGGMGAYAPVTHLSAFEPAIHQKIIQPILAGIQKEGMNFRGVLYIGLMLTSSGPYVLEFNVRWGDPECQALLPLLVSSFSEISLAVAEGNPIPTPLFSPLSAVCVVLSAPGYPDKPLTGEKIHGLKPIYPENTLIFHAGTEKKGTDFFTSGGRVLNVVGLGKNIREARNIAYSCITTISFPGMHYRKDIAWRALQ